VPNVFKLNIYPFLLIFLCLFHLVGNFIWINLNKIPFAWDPAGHTIIAFRFTDFFKFSTSENFLSISDYYPPFIHLLVSFLMLIFGKNILIGPMVVTSFFILSIIFLYLYTSELFKDKRAGFLAALLFSLLPNMYALSREFLLEIPILAMALGTLFFLEKSDYFQNRKNTVLFGLFLSLALAIKWNVLIFLFVPVIVKLVKNFPSLAWKNLLLVAVVVLVINLPWYIHNYPVILHALSITSTAESADPQTIFSWENFKFYPFMITNFQLTWVGMLAFLISAIYFIKRRRSYLLPTYVFVYLVATLIGNKDLRYVIFLAPLATMIIAYFLVFQKYKIVAKILTTVLVLYLVFYYFVLSFGVPVNPKKVDFRRSQEIPGFGWIDLINLGKDTNLYLAPLYDQTVWPNSTIASELSKHNPGKDIKILVLCEKPNLNQVNMELTRRQLNLNQIQFMAPYDLPPFSDEISLEKYLVGFDVTLVASKDLGPEGGIRYFAVLKQISMFLEANKSTNLIKINNYFLPDGDRLDVFKPKVDPI